MSNIENFNTAKSVELTKAYSAVGRWLEHSYRRNQRIIDGPSWAGALSKQLSDHETLCKPMYLADCQKLIKLLGAAGDRYIDLLRTSRYTEHSAKSVQMVVPASHGMLSGRETSVTAMGISLFHKDVEEEKSDPMVSITVMHAESKITRERKVTTIPCTVSLKDDDNWQHDIIHSSICQRLIDAFTAQAVNVAEGWEVQRQATRTDLSYEYTLDEVDYYTVTLSFHNKHYKVTQARAENDIMEDIEVKSRAIQLAERLVEKEGQLHALWKCDTFLENPAEGERGHRYLIQPTDQLDYHSMVALRPLDIDVSYVDGKDPAVNAFNKTSPISAIDGDMALDELKLLEEEWAVWPVFFKLFRGAIQTTTGDYELEIEQDCIIPIDLGALKTILKFGKQGVPKNKRQAKALGYDVDSCVWLKD